MPSHPPSETTRGDHIYYSYFVGGVDIIIQLIFEIFHDFTLESGKSLFSGALLRT